MNKYLRLFYLSSIFFIASCAYRATGWRSNSSPGKTTASFKYFNGKSTDTISLSAGSVLFVAYKTYVSAGDLKIFVLHDNNILWHRKIETQPDSSSVKFPVAESGKYKIVVAGEKASGGFQLAYHEIKSKQIQVAINKNIELFGLMMQLDMGNDLENAKDTVIISNRRSTWRDWYLKSYQNYLVYKSFENSHMMKLYRDNQAKGFYNDFYIGFLLQVDQVPEAKINSGTSDETILGFSKTGNPEEAKQKANDFLNQLNAFYKEVNFAGYLKDNQKYYALIKADVEKNVPPDGFIPIMESFYQKSFKNYYLIPSLNIPTSMGFGKMNKGTQTVYNAFGPFSFQHFDPRNLDLGFNHPDVIRGLSVHEFGHSFVNAAIDKIPDSLRSSTEYLYSPIKDAMSKLAYTNWTMCLYEHFVKAGEIIIARNQGQSESADKTLSDNVKAKFIYLPFIVGELERYNNDKSSYKSYDDYVQVVLEKLKQANPPKN